MANQGMHPERDFYQQTIASIYNDFQRQYLYRVILPNNFEGAGDNVDVITYFVSSTGTPQEQTGMIPVDWQNSQIKVAGRTIYTPWSVTVKDSVEANVYQYFNNWRRLVYNRDTGESSRPKDYKRNILLELIGETSASNIVFTMRNCYPETIGSSTKDYSAEGLMTFAVTFQYDDFETDKKIR